MDENVKKCPMCAEQIPLEAQVCRFCGARFMVAKVGYCASCHAKREADETGSCRVCKNPLIDIHVHTELIQLAVAEPAQPAPPEPVRPPGRKSRVRVGAILGFLVVCAGVIVIGAIISIPSVLPLVEPATRKPFLARMPTSTITPRLAMTPTPAPVEVDFTSIYNYPLETDVFIVGQLVLPGSVRTDEDCGVFLRNSTKYYERISIFLFVPLPGNTPLPNQMARLPDPYSVQDFEVRLDNGTYVGNYDTVRITGSICETTDGDIAICNTSKIESAE